MIRYLIVPVLIGIISSIIFSAARKEARKTEAGMDENDFVIRPPKTILYVYIAFTALFFLLYVFVMIGEYDGGSIDRWWIDSLAMSPFLALGPFLIVLWYRWKITVNGNHIAVSPYFGRKKILTLDCITRVEYGTQHGKMGGIEYVKAYNGKKKVFTVTSVWAGFQVIVQRFKMLGLISTDTPEVKEQDGQNPEDADDPNAAPPKKYNTRRVVFTVIGAVLYFVAITVWKEYKLGTFDPPDPNKAAALEAYRRGLEASSNKDYDLAIAEYTEAIRLFPDSRNDYYFHRAQLYTYQTKEYEKAIADHKESIRLNDNYVSYYCIGDIYMTLGDYANAIDYYEQSMTRKPEDSDVEKRLEEAKRLASEPRGKESINRVVSRNMGPLRDAYDKRRIDKPELSGRITVKLAIDESGKVASVQLVNSTMNDREFEDYVASQVKEWTFGKTDKAGDTVRVVLPLVFNDGR